MGKAASLFDSLRNAITGAGTSRDPRTANTYNIARCLTQPEIDAAYRGSGLMRKIIQIPAMDMVREWRCWEADKEVIARIDAEEKRLGLKQKVRMAEVLRGLGGGALILGLPGNPSAPAPANGDLAYVHVVSRWHLTYDKMQDDARLPGYGEPAMWRLSQQGGMATIHPSRVIPFLADTSAMLASPTSLNSADAFWGESRVAQVLDAVSDSDAARSAFAALLHKARLTRVGIPGLSDILSRAGGQAQVQARLEVIALAESMFNVSVYDAGEDGKSGEKIDDVAYAFAGAKDVLNAYAEFASAISDIPATRLLGRAPEGMNSSGDSQQKDWNKRIKAMQELELAPCLDRLDPYLLASSKAPLDTPYGFEELDEEDETAEATRFKTTVEAMEKIEAMGVVPATAFAKAAQNTLVEGGWMPGLDKALDEVPESERYGIDPPVDPNAPNSPDQNQPKGGDPTAGAQGAQGVAASDGAIADAAPRSLYVSRKLVNAQEFIAWAKSQGFDSTMSADQLHVTITYSRQPIDWLKIDSAWDGPDGQLIVAPGGARLVEPLGDKGAVVMLFNSSELSWRHEQIKRAGASHDFEDYQPHVTITYTKPEGMDLATVEPFRGKLVFGPEIFEEIKDDWAAGIEEV